MDHKMNSIWYSIIRRIYRTGTTYFDLEIGSSLKNQKIEVGLGFEFT